jgi:predicted nucleic acid-binding protein
VRLYFDSSALVKLVQQEAKSDALRGFLRQHAADQPVTSALSRVEVLRAVFAGGARALEHARRQLSRVEQIVLSSDLLDSAASLLPGAQLRSLDAVHLAAAQIVGEELRAVVTYDRRMAAAAEELGFVVEMPG